MIPRKRNFFNLFASVGILLFLSQLVESSYICAEYKDQLQDGSIGFCAGIITYPYYLKRGESQEDKEIQARDSLLQNSSITERLLGLLPQDCVASLKKAVCTAVFPQCFLIDPFFLDSTCSLDSTCVQSGSKAICSGGDNNGEECFMSPGLVKGKIFSWKEASFQANIPIDEFCELNGLLYSERHDSCTKVLPRLPCHSQCSDILDESKSSCPSISGYFFEMLIALYSSTDTTKILASKNQLESKGCLPEETGYSETQCKTKRFTISILLLANLAPSCSKTETDESNNTLHVFPKNYAVELEGNPNVYKDVILKQISVREDVLQGHCGPLTNSSGVSCNEIKQDLKCARNDESGMSTVQDTIGFMSAAESLCSNVVSSPVNQDLAFNKALAAKNEKCSSEIESNFLIPSYPGLPPFAPKLDLDREELVTTGSSCLASDSPNYLNVPNFTQFPLCNNGNKRGSNALNCLNSKVNMAISSVPSWVNYRCQVSMRELVCNQAHMKMELKTLCLIPEELGGCVSLIDNRTEAFREDRVAFQYSLPRFPSKDMCVNYRDECKSFIEENKQSNPAVDIDCDGRIQIEQCSPEWSSRIWPCSSAFNGLPSYPETHQIFANLEGSEIGDVLTKYAMQFKTVDITKLFHSRVVQPTISAPLYSQHDSSNYTLKSLQEQYCSCPDPLLVPDDINAKTISSSTCCAVRCEGTMMLDSELNSYKQVKFYLSLLSCILGVFQVLTWGIMKSKRTREGRLNMIFWLSFTSLFISFSLFGPTAVYYNTPADSMCKDNTQGYNQADGFSPCVLQGILLMYFALSNCCWWFCASLNLYRKLVLGVTKEDYDLTMSHFFSWILPMICVFPLIIRERFGFEGPRLWCFLSEDAPEIAEWAAFYIIVGLLWIIGTYFMISCLRYIFLHVQHSKHIIHSTRGNGKRGEPSLYRTALIFVCVFFFCWAVLFSFRIRSESLASKYNENGKKWIECLLYNDAIGVINPATNPSADNSMLFGTNSSVAGCGMTQPFRIPPAHLYVVLITLSSTTTFIFLVFGCKRQNFELWYKLLCGAQDEEESPLSEKTENSVYAKTRTRRVSSIFRKLGIKEDVEEKNRSNSIESICSGYRSNSIESALKPENRNYAFSNDSASTAASRPEESTVQDATFVTVTTANSGEDRQNQLDIILEETDVENQSESQRSTSNVIYMI